MDFPQIYHGKGPVLTQGVTFIRWRPQYWQGSNRRCWLIEGSEAQVGNCSFIGRWSIFGALSAGHRLRAAVSTTGLVPIQPSSLTGLKWVLQHNNTYKRINNIKSKSQNPKLKHWSKKKGDENSFRIVFHLLSPNFDNQNNLQRKLKQVKKSLFVVGREKTQTKHFCFSF